MYGNTAAHTTQVFTKGVPHRSLFFLFSFATARVPKSFKGSVLFVLLSLFLVRKV